MGPAAAGRCRGAVRRGLTGVVRRRSRGWGRQLEGGGPGPAGMGTGGCKAELRAPSQLLGIFNVLTDFNKILGFWGGFGVRVFFGGVLYFYFFLLKPRWR